MVRFAALTRTLRSFLTALCTGERADGRRKQAEACTRNGRTGERAKWRTGERANGRSGEPANRGTGVKRDLKKLLVCWMIPPCLDVHGAARISLEKRGRPDRKSHQPRGVWGRGVARSIWSPAPFPSSRPNTSWEMMAAPFSRMVAPISSHEDGRDFPGARRAARWNSSPKDAGKAAVCMRGISGLLAACLHVLYSTTERYPL
jgi:hypothetical protein